MPSDAPNDDAYDNRGYIPDAESYPPRWAAEAEAFRDAMGENARLGLTYGSAPRQVFDLFLPPVSASGTLVFVHGGYWRAFDRSVWSAFAAGGLARGVSVAMPSYTLAPDARIADITAEIAQALGAIGAMTDGPMYLAGHSAGGHLVARMLNSDVDLPAGLSRRLASCVPISPVGDLRPLVATRMNADFRLSEDDACAESPALQAKSRAVPVHIWVGEAERPAFLAQARQLGDAWDAPITVEPGKHHFDVIDGLRDARSPLLDAVLI